jgi:hypothetical protein
MFIGGQKGRDHLVTWLQLEDLSGSNKRPLAGCCKYGNVSLGSIEGSELVG